MKIDILTIFPEMFKGPMTCSLMNRAIQNKILDINYVDIRSFTKDKHKKVDDRPFGGGPGMLMQVEPIYLSLKSVGVRKKNRLYKNPYKKPYVIYMIHLPYPKLLFSVMRKKQSNGYVVKCAKIFSLCL